MAGGTRLEGAGSVPQSRLGPTRADPSLSISVRVEGGGANRWRFPGRAYASGGETVVSSPTGLAESSRLILAPLCLWSRIEAVKSVLVVTEFAYPGWTVRRRPRSNLDAKNRARDVPSPIEAVGWQRPRLCGPTSRRRRLLLGAIVSLATFDPVGRRRAHLRFWHPQMVDRATRRLFVRTNDGAIRVQLNSQLASDRVPVGGAVSPA